MSSKTKKLGLAADIFSDSIEGVIRKIPLPNIQPDPSQPRKNRSINIEQLAQSLREEGLLQPIVVNKEGNDKYSIVAGERRFRAAQSLGWKEIECRIISKAGKDKFRLAVIENLQRENLDAVEEAQAFSRLKNLFSYTDNDLAKIIGKSRNYISEILSIAEISSAWIEKASRAGLNSKNILVQFGQAIKNDRGQDFLIAYERGDITTVKEAKAFVQKAKGNFAPPPEEQGRVPDSNTPSPAKPQKSSPNTDKTNEKVDTPAPVREKTSFQIQAQWKNEKQIEIKIAVENPRELRSFAMDELEKYLQERLEDFF